MELGEVRDNTTETEHSKTKTTSRIQDEVQDIPVSDGDESIETKSKPESATLDVDKIQVLEPRSPAQPSGCHWWNPPGGSKPVPLGSDIHGEYWLDHDSVYYLAMVPPIAAMGFALEADKTCSVTPEQGKRTPTIIASSHKFLKLVISLSQAT